MRQGRAWTRRIEPARTLANCVGRGRINLIVSGRVFLCHTVSIGLFSRFRKSRHIDIIRHLVYDHK